MKTQKALWRASGVFAPSYPRQSSDNHTVQAIRYNRAQFCDCLQRAMEAGMPGYYSVYSFPRGHSRDGNIPKVDCIFIDLDIPGDDYDPNTGATSFGAWKRDMSALLARSRMIASSILDEDQEQHFRATLSGHKGLHLYLDFPTVAPTNGEFGQFKRGLKEYGEQVMSWLDSAAGGVNIGPWVDVDASDLGRLARHPNTIHHGSAYDDETRWCVPVTIDELAELRVTDYMELTSSPRPPSGSKRYPSQSAGKKVVQAIRNAPNSTRESETTSSVYNEAAVAEYTKNVNDEIEAEDIDFLTANFPCIQAFVKRDDAFGHRNASHVMEMNVIGKLVDLGVPNDVIHKYLADIPGYTETKTDEQIEKVIGREYSSFNCSKIANRAPQFCLGDKCQLYQKYSDIQK